VISVVLLAAASLPIAMLVYAAALTQTSRYTLDAKAGLINGSTTTVQSVDPVRRTPATDAVGTLVVRYLLRQGRRPARRRHRARDRPGHVPEDRVLGPPVRLRLARRADGQAARADRRRCRPAVAVVEDGPEFPPGAFELGLGTTTVRTEVVAHATHFSGRRVPGAMLVVDRSRLGTGRPVRRLPVGDVVPGQPRRTGPGTRSPPSTPAST
jgi:hypothetical protein